MSWQICSRSAGEREGLADALVREERVGVLPAEVQVVRALALPVHDLPVVERALGILVVQDHLFPLRRAEGSDLDLAGADLEEVRVGTGEDEQTQVSKRVANAVVRAEPVLETGEEDALAPLVGGEAVRSAAAEAHPVVPVVVERLADGGLGEALAILRVGVEELRHQGDGEGERDRVEESLLPTHDRGVVVHELHRVDVGVVPARRSAVRLRVEDRVEGELEVLGRHLVAAVEVRVLAEVDDRRMPDHVLPEEQRVLLEVGAHFDPPADRGPVLRWISPLGPGRVRPRRRARRSRRCRRRSP